jgi:hypothetical protein
MISGFVSECLQFFLNLIHDPEICRFALRVASVVIRCPSFETSCREKAFRIFIHCAELPEHSQTARLSLVTAFTPYLHQLEAGIEAQQQMCKVLELTDSPALWLVAAAFLAKRFPLAGIKRNYEDIITAPITTQDASMALRLFGELADFVSFDLMESLFAIAKELLTKFEQLIDWQPAFKLFRAARTSVSYSGPGLDLLSILFKIDPNVELNKEIDTITMSFAKAGNSMASLVEREVDVVPMTTCKQLGQLTGLISCETPPNIYPYATQYEMYVSVRNDVWQGDQRKKGGGRISGQTSAGHISPVPSFIWVLSQGHNFTNMTLPRLENKPLIMQRLELPELKRRRFIVSITSFPQIQAYLSSGSTI